MSGMGERRPALTIDRLPDEALYVSDAEIVRRLGVGEKTARVAIRELERARGFPRKDPLFGEKRYWPAVRAFLDRRAGLNVASPLVPDGKENFNGSPEDRERARPRVAASR
jgi:hypothetical protein